MESLPLAPAVRHGSCRLELRINGCSYVVRRRKGVVPGARHWHLKKLEGPRAGVTHVVTSHRGTINCSCPDSSLNGAVCKHMRAVQACGLASRRLRPCPASPAPSKGGA